MSSIEDSTQRNLRPRKILNAKNDNGNGHTNIGVKSATKGKSKQLINVPAKRKSHLNSVSTSTITGKTNPVSFDQRETNEMKCYVVVHRLNANAVDESSKEKTSDKVDKGNPKLNNEDNDGVKVPAKRKCRLNSFPILIDKTSAVSYDQRGAIKTKKSNPKSDDDKTTNFAAKRKCRLNSVPTSKGKPNTISLGQRDANGLKRYVSLRHLAADTVNKSSTENTEDKVDKGNPKSNNEDNDGVKVPAKRKCRLNSLPILIDKTNPVSSDQRGAIKTKKSNPQSNNEKTTNFAAKRKRRLNSMPTSKGKPNSIALGQRDANKLEPYVPGRHLAADIVNETSTENTQDKVDKGNPKSNNEDKDGVKVPAKQKCRLNSVPTGKTNPVSFGQRNASNLERYVPVCHLAANTIKESRKETFQNSMKKGSLKSNDLLSDVVAANCKLSNRIVDVNKIILEKNERLLQLQKDYFEQGFEIIKLKTAITDKDKEIEKLQETIAESKESQFCQDLINFDDAEANENKTDEEINAVATENEGGTPIVLFENSQMSFQWTPTE